MTTTYTDQDWLQTPLAQYLLEREQVLYDAVVADVFGFNAMQLGMPQVDLLRDSRIPFRFRASPWGNVPVRCQFTQLPFATNSADLLLLPHVLEYSANPHDTLREAERTLVPEGHLILSGFNPVSLWGMRRLFARQQSYPWSGRFLSLPRVKDWLALLGLEVVAGRMGCYAPPFGKEKWIARCRFMDKAGDRWWPMLGGVYFLVAKKRVAGMRLIRPNWNSSKVVQMLMPKPTQKTECQRTEHGK
ncbi:MAG TPA: methyltransferase domain-containing protein [Methylophilaceae bacterium]|nr:methyltransferase domain-containing protein [Methylophilaceae bacterium]HQR59918.1 methyltransferase domain-containing protein [Methylophilaceae bacterium]